MQIAHRTPHTAHRTPHIALAASALLLLASATAAHAQALSCLGVSPGTTITTEVNTGPGWKYIYSNTPPADVNNPGWLPARATDCASGPTCHSWWQTLVNLPALSGAQWVAPMPLTGPSGSVDFNYISPAITVDPNVNLSSLSMRVLGVADNYYLSTGVINGSPLALHQDGTAHSNLDNSWSSPGTVAFAAGAAPMNSWRHGVNYLFVRTRDNSLNYDFLSISPTGLLAKYTLTATCTATTPYPAVPADHPLALGLGALALAGLAGLKLRPRKA